jgi:hypothetical protein
VRDRLGAIEATLWNMQADMEEQSGGAACGVGAAEKPKDPVLSPVCKCSCGGYKRVTIKDITDDASCSAKNGNRCTVTVDSAPGGAGTATIETQLKECGIVYEESSAVVAPGVFNGGVLMP